MTLRTLIACGVGALLLSACGGGGGDGGPPPPSVSGNGFAPTSGPGDTESYYPSAAGNQWQFDYTTDDPNALVTSALVTLTVTGTQQVQGVTATVLNRADPTLASNGFDTYFQVTGGGVTNLGSNDATDAITPALVPYVQQLFPVTPGASVSTVTVKNLTISDGAGHSGTLDLTQTIANGGVETVDVPAGTFTNALKQTTVINAKAVGVPIDGTEEAWYVPGVGQVKDVGQVTGNGTTTHSTAELRFYVVNGTPHGLAPPKLLSSGNPAPPGGWVVPAATSDGTNFLFVTVQGTADPSQESFAGTLVDPYGNVQSFAVAPPAQAPPSGRNSQAAVSSDGIHYLVVYETDHSATSQPTTLSSVILSGNGTIIAGPSTVGTVTPGFTQRNPGAEAVAFDGSRYLLAYLSGSGTLTGEYLDPATGQVDGASFSLVTDTALLESPALAFDGTNFLLAWGRAADTLSPAVMAERVSTAGAVLDASPLVVAQQTIAGPATAPFLFAATIPALSFDGTNYLVSYWDYGTVSNPGYAESALVSSARVSRSLVLLDSSPIHVTSVAVDPTGRVSAAFIQGAHWLAWTSGVAPRVVSASRVSPAGTVPVAWTDGFALAADGNGAECPAITAGSSGGYSAWVVNHFNPSIYGTRIYPN